MGFGIRKVWQGLVFRQNDTNTTKGRTSKSKKILRKIFGWHIKVQQIDVQSGESDSALEPVSKDIDNAAPICCAKVEDGPGSTERQQAPIQGASIESLHPHFVDHKIEGQGLATADTDGRFLDVKTPTSVGQNTNRRHVDDDTRTDVGQALLINRPHPLRQGFRAHDSIPEHQLPMKIVRIESAVKLDRSQAFYGRRSINTDEVDESDSASTKSSCNTAWELLIKTMKQAHEIELTDLREDLEGLKAQHRNDLGAAGSTKVVLQKRVKKLLEQKESSAADVVSLTTKMNESNVLLQSAERKAELLESQLTQSRESIRVLAKHYDTTCREAGHYLEKMRAFNLALEQEPGKYVDVNREIKIRDERFLNLRAEMFLYGAEMKKVLHKNKKDIEVARAEAAELRDKLEERTTDVAYLKASRADFKRQSEEVYEMLAGRITPSSLFASMNEYFQLALKDNDILIAKIEELMLSISRNEDKMKLLSAENQSLKQQSSLDQETRASLEHKIGGLDIEIGRLEFKVDSDLEEYQRGIRSKDSVIANLQAINDERSREVDALVRGTDFDFRRLLQRRDMEIARLKADLADRTAEKRALEETVQARDQEGVTAIVTYLDELESDDLRIELRAANEELTNLRRQVQESEAGAEAEVEVEAVEGREVGAEEETEEETEGEESIMF